MTCKCSRNYIDLQCEISLEQEEITALNGNMSEAVTLHSNSVVGRILLYLLSFS